MIWFRLPPGYHTLDPSTYGLLESAGATIVAPIIEGTQPTGQLRAEMRAVVDLLTALTEQGCMHMALGVHPDGAHGACTSLFSLSALESTAPTPQTAAAQAALGMANSPLWQASRRALLELPGGTPAALVAGTLTPPTGLLHSCGITVAAQEVFQARVAVPFPDASHVAIADLTSAAVRHAEEYTDILEGIAHTFTFVNPESPSAVPNSTSSRILDLLT
ncbi:hypothetical protein [Streptomyces sp. SP18CS02]|uniref:hypothetical protein n=1 Tax=Streptomyces sp. SP18CS02 TaxID=3002531 RepID=UPI002E7824B7|nr:hypothetical protein [Streptomyces sp. SP18CS02]MEE1754043.1 hypothetical protein [Streptomyces sp. SP18CS02]